VGVGTSVRYHVQLGSETRGMALRQIPVKRLRKLFRVALSSELFSASINSFTAPGLLCPQAPGRLPFLIFVVNPQCFYRIKVGIMAPASLFRGPTRPDLYVCARCALRASQGPSRISRRWIGMKYLAKVADAEKQWKDKAAKINAGEEKSMLTILEERGLVQTVTGYAPNTSSFESSIC